MDNRLFVRMTVTVTVTWFRTKPKVRDALEVQTNRKSSDQIGLQALVCDIILLAISRL